MGPVELGTGQQLDAATLYAGVDPVAVVLDLVQPVLSVRRLLDKLGHCQSATRGPAVAS